MWHSHGLVVICILFSTWPLSPEACRDCRSVGRSTTSAFGKPKIQSGQQRNWGSLCVVSGMPLCKVGVEEPGMLSWLVSLLPAANCREKKTSDVGVLATLNFVFVG